MKKIITITLSCIFLIIASCNKSDNEINKDSLENTKWMLTKVIDNDSGESENLPSELDNYYISFRTNGFFRLHGFCRFAFGTYSLSSNNSLNILDIGPMGLNLVRICPPDIRIEWEHKILENLKSSTMFSIKQDRLTIESLDEYDLEFNFVEILELPYED